MPQVGTTVWRVIASVPMRSPSSQVVPGWQVERGEGDSLVLRRSRQGDLRSVLRTTLFLTVWFGLGCFGLSRNPILSVLVALAGGVITAIFSRRGYAGAINHARVEVSRGVLRFSEGPVPARAALEIPSNDIQQLGVVQHRPPGKKVRNASGRFALVLEKKDGSRVVIIDDDPDQASLEAAEHAIEAALGIVDDPSLFRRSEVMPSAVESLENILAANMSQLRTANVLIVVQGQSRGERSILAPPDPSARIEAHYLRAPGFPILFAAFFFVGFMAGAPLLFVNAIASGGSSGWT